MFLKLKVKIFALGLAMTSSAFAQTITTLSQGSYQLKSGEAELCRNFTITESNLYSNQLEFGGFYKFEFANSDHNVESDLDPECSFREQNRRSVSASETTLIRINEEICKGEVVSRVVSTATLMSNEVRVEHQLNGIDPYVCVWIKK